MSKHEIAAVNSAGELVKNPMPESPQAGTELAKAKREELDAALEKKMGLSMAQIIVLEELAHGESVVQAARRAQVNSGTIYRWMRHHSEFVKHHESLKRDLHEAAKSRLAGMLDRALDAVEGQIERGDGRLGLDLLREMKVTARSSELPSGASPSSEPTTGVSHRETIVEVVQQRLSVSTGGSGETATG